MNTSNWKPILPPARKFKKDLYSKIINVGEFIYQVGETEALRQLSQPVLMEDTKSPSFLLKKFK